MKKLLVLICFVFLVSFSACNLSNKEGTFFEVPKIKRTNYKKVLGSPHADLDVDEVFMDALLDFTYGTASDLLEDRNGMISPLSYYIALSELAELTKGSTQSEILGALNLDDIDTLRDGNQGLYKKLSYENKISTLSIANSIWLRKNQEVKEEPLKVLMEKYYASSYEVDFANSKDTKRIGEWISKNTGGKLGKGEYENMSPLTFFVLLNTVYFYDDWENKFDEKNNIKAPFAGLDEDVEYMNQKTGGMYFSNEDYESSSLKFKNGLSMKFVAPYTLEGLNDIIGNKEKFKAAFSNRESLPGDINYTIPKFNYKSSFNLISYTQDIGINLVFGGGDFSPLTDLELFVSDIIHKTYIEVDESGGKAAAFTGITGDESVSIINEYNFKLDRPFVYGIFKDDLAIFIGVVINPNSEDEEIY